MDLRQERIDVSMAEHKQNVEDQYNKFRIFVSIFYSFFNVENGFFYVFNFL